MGLVQFCEHKAKFYPQLVHTFYSNMKTSNDCTIKSRIERRQVVITPQLLSEKLGLPLLKPTVTLGEKVRTWPFDKLVVILPRKRSKNYVTVLDMYIIGALMTEEKISLPYFIIAHMTTYGGTDRHLPYAHIMRRFFEEVGVDLTAGGRSLDTRVTIRDTTLYKMKYRYIHAERRWIREADILQGVQYGEYEDPHPSDPDKPFDAYEYLNYSFTYPQGDAKEDHGVALGNEEVHQEIPAPQAPQPTPQPFPHAYIPQTYYWMTLHHTCLRTLYIFLLRCMT
ncbi:hypothetical protein Scep_021849 [Stephania cephalantha]|uniref:Uncharacterized protein n=1 Tax=Stephania cephalantha TaxID=152367 RepID=A0AAP0F6T0_9MAGN